MNQPAVAYEQLDTSSQGFPFESPYFPAFFRLLRWKLLDICIQSSRNGSLGEFAHFEPVFPNGTLNQLVANIKDETLPKNEYQEKIANADIDDKMRRQAEAYNNYRIAHEFRVRRRRYVEFFFTNVLFGEQGLRIADKIIYNFDEGMYNVVHMIGLPSDWQAAITFKEKFYKQEELESPYEMQLLDRVVGSSRGNLFLKDMKGNQRCDREIPSIDQQLRNRDYEIESDLVRGVLDEGPHYLLDRNAEGDELKGPKVTWTEHMSRLIFFTFPTFNVNSRMATNEHEDWYYALILAMSKDPYNRAGLFFLNRNYEEELNDIETARARERLAKMKSRETTDEVVSEIVKEIRPQPKDSGYDPDREVAALSLRPYQSELVQTALEGKNVVIVAPTGSGKTEVAIYAALNHIKEREHLRKPARVVMLVPKIPLVGQQRDRFEKYCAGRYRVEGFHGSEKSSDGQGRRDDVLQAHVVIMTPQILINMWNSVRQSERLFVSDFSMVVFDEVHKATGAHPYVEISQMIEEWQYEKPQIIGLTASLNVSIVGNADNERMYNSIYTMLAILNAPHLSAITKQENIDDLNEYVGKPDDSVEICQKPPDNDTIRSFILRLYNNYSKKLLIELEGLQKIRPNCFSPGNYLNLKKAKIEYYEQYEAYLQNIIYDLNRLNMHEKGIALLYAKYIKVYVEARGIMEIMPSASALDYLTEALDQLDNSHSLTQFNEFQKAKEGLRREEAQSNNPDIVKKLMATLTGQFEANPDSRVIIFVTQRSTAKRVCDFLNKSKIMDPFAKLGDETDAVGYVLGTNKQGAVQQSQQEQTTNIERFNNGRLKVLVATSVVEEGLDVTACNLIIKYNCSSGSAIQLVQQRGRARAKNSRSILLSVSNVVNEKENQALISEKYMKLCVSRIMKFTANELNNHVIRLKKQLDNERARQANEREMLRLKLGENLYQLKCAGCTRIFCRSNDVKKVYSNYLVFNPEVWVHLNVERKTKVNKYLSEETQPLSMLNCVKCGSTVGKAYKIRGVYLPMLEVKAISFHQETAFREDTMEIKRKWKDVEEELFYVAPPVQKDFENMLNALSGTESGLQKKKILDFDSLQHLKDVDRFRREKVRHHQEVLRKQQAANPKNFLVPRKTDFSDEEDENQKDEDD